jgi:2'-hydroxyisoflavone reductase
MRRMAGLSLLIVGGTRFLGRHFVAAALAAGHRVTLLHRGRSGPGLFPEAEHLIADRNGDLAVLDGRRFDVVIDPSAYVPRHVRTLAARLAGRAGAYQFVSSISAYADATQAHEDAPLATLADPTVEVVTGETYGGLKALCEQAALEAFGASALIVRPGLIVGPFDPSGRFTWWAQRSARSEPMLAPGPAELPVQLIDARDAAAWMLRQAEQGTRGMFNLTGPAEPLTMDGFIAALAPRAPVSWVDEAVLLAEGVAPWTDLPVWLPREQAALHRTPIARALATGLMCRPLAETVRDTRAWADGAPDGGLKPGFGLAPEREAALLRVRAGPGGA